MNIYVTGMGMVSAIGQNTAETFDHLQAERTGIGPIRHVPTRLQEGYVAGEIDRSDEALRELVGHTGPQPLTRTTALACLAVREALQQADLTELDPAIRTGLVSSSTVGGVVRTERYYQQFLAGEDVPDIVRTHNESESTEYISRWLGIRHFVSTLNTACASSSNAVVLGARLIRQGMLDRVIVGGADALCRFTLNGFNSLLLLDPELCRPFDENRKGINLGEGAAYLILESERLVNRRSARPIARLSGFGATNDAYHQTSTSPEAIGLQTAMRQALQRSGLTPDAIGYINAHGTGTPNNDATEGVALREVFAGNVPAFSSTKSFTGHTLAAAGSMGAVLSLLAMQKGVVLPNLNYRQPIADHGLEPVTSFQTVRPYHHVMANSMGMGGVCASLIFSDN